MWYPSFLACFNMLIKESLCELSTTKIALLEFAFERLLRIESRRTESALRIAIRPLPSYVLLLIYYLSRHHLRRRFNNSRWNIDLCSFLISKFLMHEGFTLLEGNDFFFQNLCRNCADEFPIEMEERSFHNCGKVVTAKEASWMLQLEYAPGHIIANNSINHLIISTKYWSKTNSHQWNIWEDQALVSSFFRVSYVPQLPICVYSWRRATQSIQNHTLDH